MKVTICIIALCLLTGCTVVRYQSTDRTLTVIDLHPGGESLSLQGTIDSIGTLDVNRDTEGASSVIGAAVDAAIGL